MRFFSVCMTFGKISHKYMKESARKNGFFFENEIKTIARNSIWQMPYFRCWFFFVSIIIEWKREPRISDNFFATKNSFLCSFELIISYNCSWIRISTIYFSFGRSFWVKPWKWTTLFFMLDFLCKIAYNKWYISMLINLFWIWSVNCS